jgi:hypothetical protein
MWNTADVTGGKLIAVLLQSMSGVSAIKPLVAFYDIHEGKREVLFFYFVPDITRGVVVSFFYWRNIQNATATSLEINMVCRYFSKIL